jgi:ribosomal protein S18 acetylase RimI-like enzyme
VLARPAVSEVDIIELSPDLLTIGATLLAAHMAGRSEPSLAECERILRCLLDFPSAQFVLAHQLGQYCGFAALHWGFSTTAGLPILRVQDLFVASENRRQGIARALLQYAADLGRARGAHRLQLETDTSNIAARSLYLSFGFEWFPQKEIFMCFLQAGS